MCGPCQSTVLVLEAILMNIDWDDLMECILIGFCFTMGVVLIAALIYASYGMFALVLLPGIVFYWARRKPVQRK
jgi:hypothetical protein